MCACVCVCVCVSVCGLFDSDNLSGIGVLIALVWDQWGRWCNCHIFWDAIFFLQDTLPVCASARNYVQKDENTLTKRNQKNILAAI